MQFNIICASHNENILTKNLGASMIIEDYPVTVLSGYSNISKAYNTVHKLCNPLLDEYNLYIHHDVFLPVYFEHELKRAILQINSVDKNWGVLGVAGAIVENGTRKFFGRVKDRGREWGRDSDLPKEVQTLDELLLITKGDLVFDDQFDLHFYGADICMQAINLGRKNYAISAYVHHNSSLKLGYRSDSFRECEAKFKNKWLDMVPIATTCAIIN